MKVHTSPTVGVTRCRAETKCPYGTTHDHKRKPTGRALFEDEAAYQADRRRKQTAARDAWRQRQRDLKATEHLPEEDKAAADTLSEALPDDDLDALYDAFYASKHARRSVQLQLEWLEACQRAKHSDLGDARRMEGVARRAKGLRNPAVRKTAGPWAPRLFGRRGRLALGFMKWFFNLYPMAVDRVVGKPSDWL